MQFINIFEHAVGLPQSNARVGIMSVDTLDRQWDLVKLLPRNRVVAMSKDKEMVLLGRLVTRYDGKFCVELEVQASFENGSLCAFEKWHLTDAEFQVSFKDLTDAVSRYV